MIPIMKRKKWENMKTTRSPQPRKRHHFQNNTKDSAIILRRLLKAINNITLPMMSRLKIKTKRHLPEKVTAVHQSKLNNLLLNRLIIQRRDLSTLTKVGVEDSIRTEAANTEVEVSTVAGANSAEEVSTVEEENIVEEVNTEVEAANSAVKESHIMKADINITELRLEKANTRKEETKRARINITVSPEVGKEEAVVAIAADIVVAEVENSIMKIKNQIKEYPKVLNMLKVEKEKRVTTKKEDTVETTEVEVAAEDTEAEVVSLVNLNQIIHFTETNKSLEINLEKNAS